MGAQQLKLQLVFEMEDLFTYKQSSFRGHDTTGIHFGPGPRKRIHRYNLDAPKTKVVRTLPQQPFDCIPQNK